MAIKTLYTAVGRFERRTNGCNRSCPIILLGGQEYMVDMQEMVIWSMLNWRILRWDDIAQEYEKLSTASGYCTERSWEDCTNRLLTRGLLVSGSGETEYDALYDLLGSLSIIPTSGPFFLRLASFVKLTLLAHVPVSAARKLFQKDKRTKYETLVMRLAGQALLSTAEIIKCIDKNISRLPNATPPNRQPVDPRIWYETQGRSVLEALISDLNSRGHSKLTLRENGDICIEQGEDAVSQEHLNNFPQKVYWPRLAEVLESNGLAAEVTAQGIQVSW